MSSCHTSLTERTDQLKVGKNIYHKTKRFYKFKNLFEQKNASGIRKFNHSEQFLNYYFFQQ